MFFLFLPFQLPLHNVKLLRTYVPLYLSFSMVSAITLERVYRFHYSVFSGSDSIGHGARASPLLQMAGHEGHRE